MTASRASDAEEMALSEVEMLTFSVPMLRAGTDTVLGIFAIAALLRQRGVIVDVEFCEVAPYDGEKAWENCKEFYFLAESRTPIASCRQLLDVLRDTPPEKVELALGDLSFFAALGMDKDNARQTLVSDLDLLKRTASAAFHSFGKTGNWDNADHREFINMSAEVADWLTGWIVTRLRKHGLIVT